MKSGSLCIAALAATVISVPSVPAFAVDNNAMLLPILATVLLARGASALLCREPVYKALAMRLIDADRRKPEATP